MNLRGARGSGHNANVADDAEPGLVELVSPRVGAHSPWGAGLTPGQALVERGRVADRGATVDVHGGVPAVIDHGDVPPAGET